MASLSLENVVKRFEANLVVDDVSLTIRKGEFVALLGPSGCGKTTILRMIAGFETLSAGSISFDGAVVAGNGVHVPPEDRNVAIVFQSYALWPHMSVGENVAYPLRVRGIRGEARAAKTAEALAAVDLSGFEARRPADLSGGQRQRVALARCLTMEPTVVLLDEPLANLDVHLRASMEETFKRFHERTGATMVYVTHDQAEAMAMADRIAVMEHGRILQASEPAVLYARPRTEAVARFVGNGHVVDCRILDRIDAGRCRIALFGTEAEVRCDEGAAHKLGETVRLCLRAEDLALVDEAAGFPVRVVKATFKGSHSRLDVEPAAAPGLHLPLNALAAPAVGSIARVALGGGWLLPR